MNTKLIKSLIVNLSRFSLFCYSMAKLNPCWESQFAILCLHSSQRTVSKHLHANMTGKPPNMSHPNMRMQHTYSFIRFFYFNENINCVSSQYYVSWPLEMDVLLILPAATTETSDAAEEWVGGQRSMQSYRLISVWSHTRLLLRDTHMHIDGWLWKQVARVRKSRQTVERWW